MNHLKTCIALLALGGAAYAVYVTINAKTNPPPPGYDEAEPWSAAAPSVELGQPLVSGEMVPTAPGGPPPSYEPPGTPLPETTLPTTELSADGYRNTPPPPVEATPQKLSDMEYQRVMQSIDELLARQELAAGLKALTSWYDDPRLTAEQNERVTQLLDQLAGTVIYSRQHWLVDGYEVQSGDSLEDIAARYQVPWQLLAKINGIQDPRRLRPGQRLKIVPGPFEAVVDLNKHRLTLVVQGLYAGRFTIGVGQNNSTPIGEFKVQKKVLNPSWSGPNGNVAPGDPANPLGNHWIDLGGGIGIHGTNDPSSIGQNASEGCIRLGQRDIEDVFDILSEGSRVVVQGASLGQTPDNVAERYPETPRR